MGVWVDEGKAATLKARPFLILDPYYLRKVGPLVPLPAQINLWENQVLYCRCSRISAPAAGKGNCFSAGAPGV